MPFSLFSDLWRLACSAGDNSSRVGEAGLRGDPVVGDRSGRLRWSPHPGRSHPHPLQGETDYVWVLACTCWEQFGRCVTAVRYITHLCGTEGDF